MLADTATDHMTDATILKFVMSRREMVEYPTLLNEIYLFALQRYQSYTIASQMIDSAFRDGGVQGITTKHPIVGILSATQTPTGPDYEFPESDETHIQKKP